MKINIIGTIFGSSGYASHTRQLFNALVEEGAEVNLETMLPPAWEGLVTDQELKAIKQEHYNDGYTVFIGTPPYWTSAMNEPCKRFIGFCVWEGDKVPLSWLKPLQDADGVLVPSQHVKNAILNTGVINTPIVIVPHGVDTALFQPSEFEEPHNFTFVINKGWSQGLNDRGGVQFALKAFSEEFTEDEPVDLRVKINTVYNAPGWNFQDEIKKLNLNPGRKAIFVMTDTVAYKAMPKIYHGGDVFLNPTMGEAFSIPCAEAMACGLPVITTDFGGQTDFVTEENGWLVKSEPFEVLHDIMYEGISWHRPDVAELRAIMRKAYESKSLVMTKGLKAREDIESFTWHSSAKKLLDALRSMEQ